MHRRGESLSISILRRIVSCAVIGKAVWYSDSMKCNEMTGRTKLRDSSRRRSLQISLV